MHACQRSALQSFSCRSVATSRPPARARARVHMQSSQTRVRAPRPRCRSYLTGPPWRDFGPKSRGPWRGPWPVATAVAHGARMCASVLPVDPAAGAGASHMQSKCQLSPHLNNFMKPRGRKCAPGSPREHRERCRLDGSSVVGTHLARPVTPL